MKTYFPKLGREAPDYALVKRDVGRILQENSITDAPVSPKEIAENYNLRVYFANFPSHLSQVMGYYDPKENCIVVNDDDRPNRQTFTIAHELGHAILHKEFIINHPEDYRVLLRQPLGSQKDAIEQEANAFAAHLLVPRAFLDKYVSTASVPELARLFVVSEEVIRWRLKNEKLAMA